MNGTSAGIAGFALLLALLVPMTIFGEDAEPEDDQVNPRSTDAPAATGLPPIDADTPEKTETATFGLG